MIKVARLAKPASIPEAVALTVGSEQEAIASLRHGEFSRHFAQLAKASAAAAHNPGSYQCSACVGCFNCMFCVECESCYHCTHCQDCHRSTYCTHCSESKNCHSCAYCVRCEDCTNSAYLTMCKSLWECNYCFGCVGLSKRDFHILNVEFPRKEYFRITSKLFAELK